MIKIADKMTIDLDLRAYHDSYKCNLVSLKSSHKLSLEFNPIFSRFSTLVCSFPRRKLQGIYLKINLLF
jgi:hypothetical protein